MLALRSGKPGNLYGFAEETPEAKEGKPPKEASALQIVSAAFVRPPRLRLVPPEATILNMISGKNGSVPSLRGVLLGLAVLFLHSAALARAPVPSPSPPNLAVKVAPAKKNAGQDDSFIL